MVKLLVFAILLASSPTTGLIQMLFRAESNCYSSCHTNYAASTVHLDACRKGCDFKLLNEDCATQCRSFSNNEDIQASCQVGCTLSRPVSDDKPMTAIDSVATNINTENVPSIPEPEHPRSIILIRLRQRPDFFNDDPIQMFRHIIRQFQERTHLIEQSLRQSFEENVKEFPTPIIDSSNNEQSLINEMQHIIKHPREQIQHFRERFPPVKTRFQQFLTDVHTEWNNFVHKQQKFSIWLFVALFLSSSAILWYMIVSLCRHTPSRDALSIRAQELVFHPYDYETYEKEKIQPDNQPYEVTEALPIKVKLSNI